MKARDGRGGPVQYGNGSTVLVLVNGPELGSIARVRARKHEARRERESAGWRCSLKREVRMLAIVVVVFFVAWFRARGRSWAWSLVLGILASAVFGIVASLIAWGLVQLGIW